MDKLLTIKEVAELVKAHPNTLRRWEKEGVLKPIKTPGGHRRYRLSEIERFMRGGE